MENEWADIRDQTTYSPDAFDKVYQQVMSGKPRFAGAQAALEYFGVPDAETRAKTYGDHKQEMVVKLIEAGSSPPTRTRCGSSSPSRTPGSRSRPPPRQRTRGLFLRQIRLDTFAAENGISV